MISSDLMDVWWSLCRRRRREKKRQESIISRELESCAGASVDLDVAKMRFKNLRFVDFGIVFWSLCRPRRRLKKGQVSRRSKSTFFILSAVFLSG